MNRRDCLKGLSAAAVWGGQEAPAQTTNTAAAADLPLVDYQPRSMLHVDETHVARARYPLIDFHTHVTFGPNLKPGDTTVFYETPENLLAVMDRKNIHTLVDLTGGVGNGLKESIARLAKAHPGRFIVFTEPWWSRTNEPGYAKFQADEIQRAHAGGAKGVKVLKTLGLYLRENITTGPLIKIDDPRFDPMWETAGALNMPVAIHSSDPEAFFLPIDRFNERYEELHAHPDWSFYGRDFPSNRELQEARLRVIARHPKTTFVCLHVADSENLALVTGWMDRYPNMWVDIAARIGELGRQPRASRRFFDRFQDRIVFGTDATPKGVKFPQQLYVDKLYEIYYRFLETEDEYFDYAPAVKPPQGRWRIYGIGLPGEILEKVYNRNAARALGL
jgi:predicted TIM-barrel fold metal-dependent hydrolase